MTDQYPQGNTLNEQEEEWKEANNSSKIRCPYHRPTDKQFSNTESTKTIPIVNKYPDRYEERNNIYCKWQHRFQ